MPDYEERLESVDVPANTGIKGFLHVIESILKQPRVQNITIDARGRVSYSRYVRKEEEQAPLALNFESLAPYSVIRNGKVTEVTPVSKNAAVALSQMFNASTGDHLNPVAFVGGALSKFWKWYTATAGVTLTSQEELYGIPFLTDRMVEDNILILCSAYAKGGMMADTQKSYKIVIPSVEEYRT